MTRNQKIIIGVVAGVVVLCLAVCVVGFFAFRNFGQAVVENSAQDPQQAAAMGQEIASFTPPAGFTAQTGIKLMGFNMVFYNSPSKEDTVIILLQMPTKQELTDADFNQMRDTLERQSGRRLDDVQTIEDKAVTIRGKPARIVTQEGVNSEGSAYRQMMVAFQGNNGLAFMSVSGPVEEWDQAEFDQMVGSIK